MLETTRRWLTAHPNWALTFVTLAVLAPFLAKPFNIDDPLFIWGARQIYLHPGDPYGFDANWAQTVFPMWNVMDNPPLACYYLALGAGFLGWSEIGLHLAFLLPALAVVLGTRRLAGRFCRHPSLAALATLFTPVFMVSGMTVMCDMLMLAFWVWAVIFWVEGMERDDFGFLALSGLLVALAALTKYYGVSLLPLLLAYGLFRLRRPGRWMIYLLIPLAALYAYQVATIALYGHNLLLRAVQFTSFFAALGKQTAGHSPTATALTALAFTGGCVAAATFFAPLLWRRWALAASGLGAVLIAAVLLFSSTVGNSSAGVKFQIVFWAAGGIGVATLAIADVVQRRDAGAWLLALWVLGTLSFTAFCNWTVNGRSILPMTPAVGILIVRRLEKRFPAGDKVWFRGAVICLAASAALSLLVTHADVELARAVRESARDTYARLHSHGRNIWFQDHWGFQYYMEEQGALAIDLENPALKPGDKFAVPVNNTHLRSPKLDTSAPGEVITVSKSRFLTTMDESVGAGFYASLDGPLPFAFGAVPPEQVNIFNFNGYLSEPATSPAKN
jgi:4-amino-4-deoxy-L-arabinose transferase-like glycosyltransferase